MSLAEAVSTIPDGALLGIGHPAPQLLVEELIRQRRRNLRLLTVPTGGLAAELLIAAGCVAEIETSAVDLGEHGLAPAFSRAVIDGSVKVRDSSCPALLMALQAGASGIPFTPVPGLLGSDLIRVRPDFRIVDDPYHPGRKLVLVPALQPDFALVHARRADPLGNAVIGIGRDDRLLIRAAGSVIVSCDRLEEREIATLGANEQLIPAAFIDRLVLAPNPLGEAAAVAAYLERVRAVQR